MSVKPQRVKLCEIKKTRVYFLKKPLEDISPLLGSLIPLFRTSGSVSSLKHIYLCLHNAYFLLNPASSRLRLKDWIHNKRITIDSSCLTEVCGFKVMKQVICLTSMGVITKHTHTYTHAHKIMAFILNWNSPIPELCHHIYCPLGEWSQPRPILLSYCVCLILMTEWITSDSMYMHTHPLHCNGLNVESCLCLSVWRFCAEFTQIYKFMVSMVFNIFPHTIDLSP